MCCTDSFEQEMKELIVPYNDQFCRCSYFYSFDGAKLFYRHYNLPFSQRDVMIIHGFSEFTKKYEEMIYRFLKEGCSVYIMDLRGHGYSEREVADMCKVHISSFEIYLRDVHEFVEKIIKQNGHERILFAHSMGGGIAALHMEAFQNDFHRVILSSPMIQMNTGKLSFNGAYKIAKMVNLLGEGKRYAIGQSAFPGEKYRQTGITERSAYFYNLRKTDMHYQTWGATYGWVLASCRATEHMKSIRNIKVPTLMMTAGKDSMVNTAESAGFAEKINDVTYVCFEDAEHEIFNSGEKERVKFYKEIFDFISH